MDLFAAGNNNEGIGDGGGGYVRPLLPEYCCPVYHQSADTGAMFEDRAIAGGAGVEEMVGVGRNKPGAGRDKERDGYRGGGRRGRQ